MASAAQRAGMDLTGSKIHVGAYKDGNTAITVLDSEGAPYASLSTNIPGCHLPFGSFVLNHDANGLLDWMESTGLFEKTKATVSYGFVKEQPIYKLVAS